jgi:hypothetical protein
MRLLSTSVRLPTLLIHIQRVCEEVSGNRVICLLDVAQIRLFGGEYKVIVHRVEHTTKGCRRRSWRVWNRPGNDVAVGFIGKVKVIVLHRIAISISVTVPEVLNVAGGSYAPVTELSNRSRRKTDWSRATWNDDILTALTLPERVWVGDFTGRADSLRFHVVSAQRLFISVILCRKASKSSV